MSVSLDEIVLTGVPICRGIAIGRLYFLRGEVEEIPHITIHQSKIEDEVRRYRQAARKAKQEIRELQKRLRNDVVPEGAAILEAHLQILKDSLFSTDIERQIRALGKNAEYVFYQTLQQFRVRFNTFVDPYFRERGRDIEDIGRRIMGHLIAHQRTRLSMLPRILSYSLKT